MSQAGRVYSALLRAGSEGITPIDFAAPDVIDGGPPIMRVAARIRDLREEGFNIDTVTEARVARYSLAD